MRKFIIAAGLAAALITPSTAMAKDSAPAPVIVTGRCNADNLVSTPDAPFGSVAFGKGVATFSVPDANSWAVIRTFPVNLKVKDIKTLSFKSNSSLGGGMVYMQIITNKDADGIEHRIKYTPFEPNALEPGIGSWYSHNVLTSGVRYGEDINDSLPTTTWADAVSHLGNNTVNRVAITAGCALNSGTVQVDRIQVNNTVTAF
jgi:hypothetical protein